MESQTLHLHISGEVVPEPSTLVLVAVGAISLLAYAWRWRRV
ncbi:MAG: PEP-CTERM sorting domain-containing protein [Thermoguttaceae bacterium]